jgi:hypothetical protein
LRFNSLKHILSGRQICGCCNQSNTIFQIKDGDYFVINDRRYPDHILSRAADTDR